MDLDYVTVDAAATFEEVAQRVRRHEERTDRIPTVFVTEGDELLGELPGGTLAMTETESASLTEYVIEVPTVPLRQARLGSRRRVPL